ncbi:transmembrane protein 169a [Triplophysa dalaica]|uniref:transmembrane protein 169a n=1 Tax=Triplophysa dalaica TaxID=1582913 RepID=UPI0024E008C4|nr:transmembrane protein 169a [Triplophysa dalaica]XP_056591469.1 transmembrane protein 169a [Triplophysa dalaica]
MSEGTSGDTNTMELEGVITAEETPVNTLQRLTEDEGTTTRRKKKKKKKEIIYRSDLEVDDAGEGTSADVDGNLGLTFEEDDQDIPPDSRFVTLTGTITRGKRKGQTVDIYMTLTNKELRDMARSKERLDAECDGVAEAKQNPCTLGVSQGPHVLIWSLSCSPFIFLLSFITSFYYGTLTWYNIFLVYNEERSFLHKITLCPLLILLYPVLIMVLCFCMGVYAAVNQLSWVFGEWWLAVRDLEKGFFGWMCGKLGLEDCAPYDVVELLDSDTLSGTLQGRRMEDVEQTSSL